MRDLFERHAETLTAEERRAIWNDLAGRGHATGGLQRWLVAATAGAVALAAVVVAISMLERAPQVPPAGKSSPVARRTGQIETPGETDRPVAPDRAAPGDAPGAGVVGTLPQPGPPRAVPPRALPRRALEAALIEPQPSTTEPRISAEQLEKLPVDNLREAVAVKAGVVAQDGNLHVRGGRSGEETLPAREPAGDRADGQRAAVGKPPAPLPSPLPRPPAPGTRAWGETKALYRGGPPSPPSARSVPAPPPVVPTTGGTRLPNDEPYDSMFFRNYGVNPFIATDEDPLSTFAVDVDAASYTVMRRYVSLGHLPPADAVRVEEFVNFFPQGYPHFEHEDFRILMEGAPSPFGSGYQLLRVGIKGREVDDADRKPVRLTFVIDVSGSMARENRLGLVKRTLHLLLDRLHGDDQVGIVVYGSTGRDVLEPMPLGGQGDDSPEARRRVLDAIDQLVPGGSTNAEDGLQLGYEMARRMYRQGAINRIVLCSDGVANVGRTGPESILARVRREADRGIRLTTIGFGMGNYNDVLMEQLADRGDGNHYYVDDLDEARRVLADHLTGTLQTIAQDAKVQVEFDSTRVLRYRLLGFENRDIADRDFRNDKVDAGEIGAGHEVTALYEVKLAPGVKRGTIATVRFRYARPDHETAGAPDVREIEERLDAAALERWFQNASPHFRLDAAVAEFAEILRGSYWAKESRIADVLPVARSAAAQLGDEPSAEFVSILEQAAALREDAGPER